MDAQETKQDALPGEGQPSVEESKEPSAPKTYTEEEVTKLVNARHSKLDKTIDEQKKLIDSLSSQRDELTIAHKALAGELEAVKAQIEDAELSKVKGDPGLLKLYQNQKEIEKRTKALAQREKDLAQREATLTAQTQEIAKVSIGAKIAETAVKHGVSVADLEQELEDLGITDPGRFDKVAEKLAARKGGKAGEGLVTDSGLSVGGGKPTDEELAKMPMEQYKAYREKEEKQRNKR